MSKKKELDEKTQEYANQKKLDQQEINEYRPQILGMKATFKDEALKVWSNMDKNQQIDIIIRFKEKCPIQTDSIIIHCVITEALKESYVGHDKELAIIDFLFGYKFEHLSINDVRKFKELL